MSWLSPRGTVSYLELPRVRMWAVGELWFSDFPSSGLDFRERQSSDAVNSTSLSFFRIRELARSWGSGVEFKGVSLRKLTSELHSSRWKLFLQSITHQEIIRRSVKVYLNLEALNCFGVSTSVDEEQSEVNEPFLLALVTAWIFPVLVSFCSISVWRCWCWLCSSFEWLSSSLTARLLIRFSWVLFW